MTSETGRSNLLATYAARQSVGTTSKPAPGTAVIPARRISSSRDHIALEDFNFTCDIDVVRLRSQACIQHRSGSSREWTRHVHNARNVFQGFRQLLSVIEPDHARWQTQPIAQFCQRVFVAACENNIEFFCCREFGRQATRIAIGSVQ